MRQPPVPSDRALTGLTVLAGAVGGIFLLWLVTLAAAGTHADLPSVQIVAPGADPDPNPITTAWRLLNATLAGAAAFGLWLRWFHPHDRRDSFLKGGELVLCMAAVVGAVHMVVLHGPLTIATPFVTISCGLTLVGLVRTGRM